MIDDVDAHMPVVPKEHESVCAMGQGAATCRYLMVDGRGLICGKSFERSRRMIDERVAAGLFTAVGDNCDGL